MSDLAWKGVALLLAGLLLIAVGTGFGVWVAAGRYRPQLETAQ